MHPLHWVLIVPANLLFFYPLLLMAHNIFFKTASSSVAPYSCAFLTMAASLLSLLLGYKVVVPDLGFFVICRHH
jgi:hypothetical protein